MSDRKKAAKVGIFTFVVGLLFAIVLVTFGGIRLWKHQHRYFVELQDTVMGLSEGTGVYFNGIHVGSVHSIALDQRDPSRVRIAIDVDDGTPMRADTKAIMSSTGLTGLKTIDLQGGAPTSAALPPDSIIPAGTSGLDKIQKDAEIVADQASKMMLRARAILDDADKVVANLQQVTDPKALGAIMTATTQAATNLAQVTDPRAMNAILEQTHQTAVNLAHASQAIDTMVAENREVVKAGLASVGRATDNAGQVATDLRNLIHANQANIASMLADLRQAARTFKDLAREVREKPSRLMFSSAPDERKLP